MNVLFVTNDLQHQVSTSQNVRMRVQAGEKSYKFSPCDKSFIYFSHLQQHKRHVNINRRPYHCPYCGKLFKIHIQLKRHVRIHTDAKPYSCRHCSDCFRTRDQLETHLLKSHNEGTWFTCDICQKEVSIRCSLRKHIHSQEYGNVSAVDCTSDISEMCHGTCRMTTWWRTVSVGMK